MNSPVPHHRPAPPRPGRRLSLESRRDALPVRRDTEHREQTAPSHLALRQARGQGRPGSGL